MTLDRNVDNFFSEVEQLAFSPALIVPGIGFTDDKMLQTRLFSYGDTTRYRLGANFLQIPVNAPKKVNAVTTQDGRMPMVKKTGHVNYFPSAIEKDAQEAPSSIARPEIMFSKDPVGPEVRTREHIPKVDHFTQAGDRFRSFDPERKERFIGRIAKLVGHPKVTEEIKSRWISFFQKMDPEAGEALSAKLNEKIVRKEE